MATFASTVVASATTPADGLGSGHHGGRHHAGVEGTVTSVDGSAAADSCGGSGSTGTFIVTTRHGRTVNVDVTSATTFAESSAPSPSFADVCTGGQVAVVGTRGSTPATLTATKVFVAPTKRETTATVSPPPAAAGNVAAVDSSSSTGSCGTTGAPGTFTLTEFGDTTATVDVTSSTTFSGRNGTSTSFADVCVGAAVAVLGDAGSTATSLTAAKVFVFTPLPPPPPAPFPTPTGAWGTVTAVNGASTPGSCGTDGATGTFSLAGRQKRSLTVDVTTATTFSDPAASPAGFADVCVGRRVAVVAAPGSSSSALTASRVAVLVPPTLPPASAGKVASVDGASTPGSCGSAGAAGSFTLSDLHGATLTVDVTAATIFAEPGHSSASFADVCVGTDVAVLASAPLTSGELSAAKVFVLSARPPSAALLGAPPHGSAPGATPAAAGRPPTSTDVHPPADTVDGPGAPGSATVTGPVTAKGPGSLTVGQPEHAVIVGLTAATTYAGPGASAATVGVGNLVRVVGTESAGTFTADSVTVLGAAPLTPAHLPVGPPGASPAPAPATQGTTPWHPQPQPSTTPIDRTGVPPTLGGQPAPGGQTETQTEPPYLPGSADASAPGPVSGGFRR